MLAFDFTRILYCPKPGIHGTEFQNVEFCKVFATFCFIIGVLCSSFIVLGCQLALRVPPAETRLTVYRRLHIPAQGTLTMRTISYITRRASTVCFYSRSNTGAGRFDDAHHLIHCPNFWVFAGFVLLMCLSDLHAPLGKYQYTYD